MSTKPASSALYYMVVNPGLHSSHKNASSRCSTWCAFVRSLELHGRTRCETMMLSQELAFHPCPHSYINVIYAGWATFTEWKMGASLRIYCMVSLPLGLGVEAAPTTPQGCMQAWHESMQQQNWVMGSLCRQQNLVGAASVTRSEMRGGCHLRKNDEWWARRTASQQEDHPDPHQASVFTCQGCTRDCKSRIGLYGHTRQCSSVTSHSATP